MKHTTAYEVLTDPDFPLDAGFRHMSYALFRTDGDCGRVIGTRFPAASFLGVGDLLQSRLHLSDEALVYLVRPGRDDRPLFCLSRAGLGILCKRYDAALGVGLYLHIHGRPDAGARLLCAGALGAPNGVSFGITDEIRAYAPTPPDAADARSFPALLDAWRAVQIGSEGAFDRAGILGHADARESICCTLGEVADALESMAAFAGCAVDVRIAPDGCGCRVACHRPRVLEALFLCLLTEIRTHAMTRSATVELSAVSDPRSRWECRFCASFSYPVDTLHMTGQTRTRLADVRQYLVDAADLSGLDLHFPLLTPPDVRAGYARRTPEETMMQTVTMEWLTDPAVLPSGDLKIRHDLYRREDADG